MSATQRELREAYQRGLMDAGWQRIEALVKARELYPPKTVSRPREVLVDGWDYRVEPAGFLSRRHQTATVWESYLSSVDVERLRDLLTNPTETVEED